MKSGNFIAQTSALVAGKWVQDGLKFLILLWLARTDQSGFGLFVFGFGVAIMIRSVLALGLDQFTLRELSLDLEARGRILSQMIRLKVLVGLLALIGILTFGWLQGWSRTETLVVLIISAGQILEGVADTLFTLYRYAGRQVQEGLCSALSHVFGALYGAVALSWGGGVVAVAFFFVISHGLKALLAAAFGNRAQLFPPLSRWGAVLPPRRIPDLLMIATVSVLGSFYNQMQVFLLKYFKGLDELALYGAARGLVGGLADLVASFILGGVLYPRLLKAAANGSASLAEDMNPYFWRTAAFGLGIAFFFLTLGGDLLSFIYGPKYADSAMPLQILALSIIFAFVNNLFIYAFLAQGRERLLLWLHLAPVLVSLVLGQLLIPRLGANGAALNLLACRGTMTILTLIAAQQLYGIFSLVQVGAFLGGGLVLGSIYLSLLTIGLPAPRLLAGLTLFGYAWWTWYWTLSPANLWEARKGKRYEAS